VLVHRQQSHRRQKKNSKKKEKASHFHGVYLHRRRSGSGKPWQAQVYFNGKSQSLGYFACEVSAARAYDDFVRKKQLDCDLNFAHDHDDGNNKVSKG